MINVAFTYLFLKEDNDWTEDNLLSNCSHFNLLVYKPLMSLGVCLSDQGPLKERILLNVMPTKSSSYQTFSLFAWSCKHKPRLVSQLGRNQRPWEATNEPAVFQTHARARLSTRQRPYGAIQTSRASKNGRYSPHLVLKKVVSGRYGQVVALWG